MKQNDIYHSVWNIMGNKYMLMEFEFVIQNLNYMRERLLKFKWYHKQ